MADVLLPDAGAVELSLRNDNPDRLRLSPAWPASVARWAPYIEAAAVEYSIHPDMIAAVMTVESAGNPGALSSAGARGLMQIMPFWHCVSWEPEANIRCGVHIMAHYQQRAGGDWRAGLAAYNAGERGRDTYGRGWGYADTVLAHFARAQQ